MISLRKVSDEVLYPQDEIVCIQSIDLIELKRLALLNKRQRVRLCTHQTPQDLVHEMMIVHTPACYVRPHKHLDKSESFTVLEGRVDVVLFHDDGRIRDIVPMGSPDSGLNFYYRLSSPIFHTLIIRSEFLIFHEVTRGPFKREEMLFANWSREHLDMIPIKDKECTFVVEQMKHREVALNTVYTIQAG